MRGSVLICGSLWLGVFVDDTSAANTGARLGGVPGFRHSPSLSTESTCQLGNASPRGSLTPESHPSAQAAFAKGTREAALDIVPSILQAMLPFWSTVTHLFADTIEPAVKDPQGRIVEPVSNFVHDHIERAKERQERYQQHPREALAFAVLHPARIVRLTVGAFLLGEVMQRIGFFDDDIHDKPISKRLKYAWYRAQEPLVELQFRVQSWWLDARFAPGGLLQAPTWLHPQQTLSQLSPRHQFAVGATVGMVMGPFLTSIASRIFQLGSVAYVLSEANQYCRVQSGASAVDRIGAVFCVTGNVLDTVEQSLEQIRTTVRHAVGHPQALWGNLQGLIRHQLSSIETIPQDFRIGTIIGVVAGFFV